MNKMKLIKTKHLLLIFFTLTVSIQYGQTFNGDDAFSNKSKSGKIKTEAHIVKIKVGKTDNKSSKSVISGVILDRQTSQPVPGVNVMEKGTNNTVVTDLNGEFTLQTNNKNAVLTINSIAAVPEDVEVPKSDVGSLTSLSGLLVANLGEESIIQPNIMLSQGWKLGRHAIELRVLGLQKNKDTIQQVNGLNLIKPEISKLNFRITGDFVPLKKVENFTLNTELNIYKQQLNKITGTENEVVSNDITSMLCKLTAGYKPAKGLHFYGSGVYYNVFEGVEFYEDRFGANAIKKFWNFELSGQFVFNSGALEGTFVQASFNVNSDDYKELLDTKDSGVFFIKIGFNKALSSQ